MKQISLRPGDIAVAIQILLTPDSKLAALAESTGWSIGEVHNAIDRLRLSRIVSPDGRKVARDPLMSFLRCGVAYAFPPTVRGMAVGVPTASLDDSLVHGEADPGTENVHSLPTSEYVWPSSFGSTRGQALSPLYPFAPRLANANPRLYRLLCLVDLIRIGGAREGVAALEVIATRLDARSA